MNFYLGVADDRLRHESDQPSIGLILCQDRNRIIAEYALRGMSKPIGISQYELTRALPAALESALPTVEQIEAELRRVGQSARPLAEGQEVDRGQDGPASQAEANRKGPQEMSYDQGRTAESRPLIFCRFWPLPWAAIASPPSRSVRGRLQFLRSGRRQQDRSKSWACCIPHPPEVEWRFMSCPEIPSWAVPPKVGRNPGERSARASDVSGQSSQERRVQNHLESRMLGNLQVRFGVGARVAIPRPTPQTDTAQLRKRIRPADPT